jgi:hypothetical protein
VKRDPKRRRAAIAVALLALAVSGTSATAAFGSTWTGHPLGGEAAKVTMFGISCPTSSMCVAVGGNNTIASTSDPGGAWNVVYAGEGALPTNGIFPGRQIRGVSCPSPQLCVAVSFKGLIYTATEPTGSAAAWSVADLDSSGPSTHLYGISCPSPSFCAAAAGSGKIVTSTNPTGGAAAWSTTQLEQPLELRGVSCVSQSLCVAVGDDAEEIRPGPTDNGEIVSSTNPLGGAWGRVSMPGAQGPLYGVSCPSSALCVSGNLLGNLVISTNPTGAASAWTTTDGGGAVQITAADCPSTSQCVAVDNNGDVLTSTDPTGGPGEWTFTNVVPFSIPATEANGMFGVSCPSASLCAVAAKGQIFTSTDPFVVPPPTPKGTTKKSKKKHKKRPKRPRVTIARAPEPGVEINGSRVRVRALFFARKHVQVRGFACKLDGRPVKRCRSPKAYTVGIGKHVFRVRAIGWTGLRGPAEVARFEVCHPTFPPQCQGKSVSSR